MQQIWQLFLNTLDENVTTCQVQLFKMSREYIGRRKEVRQVCTLGSSLLSRASHSRKIACDSTERNDRNSSVRVRSQISVYVDTALMGKPKYATAYNLAINLSDPWGRQRSVVSMGKNNNDLQFFYTASEPIHSGYPGNRRVVWGYAFAWLLPWVSNHILKFRTELLCKPDKK